MTMMTLGNGTPRPLPRAMPASVPLLKDARGGIAAVAGFSMVANLLTLAVPLHSMQVFDRVLSSGSIETLAYLTLITLAALLFQGWLDMLRGRILQRIGTWLERRLAPECLRRALAAPAAGSGHDAQLLQDVAQLRQTMGGPLLPSLTDMPWVPVYMAALWLMHPALGVIALGGAAVLFGLALINELVTRRPLTAAAEAAQAARRHADIAGRIRETADILGMSTALAGRWAAANQQSLDLQEQAGERTGIILALSRTARLAVQVLMLSTGAWLVIDHMASPGTMMASSILMARALAPVEQAIGSWRSLIAARAAWRRLATTLARPESRRAGTALPAPQGRLSVERISFAPGPASRAILKGVSFDLDPGHVLAVMGHSGAGKSTLARLLVGSWPAQAGTVRLDGADVFGWDRADFGRHVGYLPQELDPFSGTAREIIGRLTAAPLTEVIAAARLAGIHDMILRLPQGYETRLGEGGLPLSCGQRQRIALARALFGNPRLVVLDEPSAFLDGEGELALVEAVAALKDRGATVVAIIHRPALMRLVDRILVLRDGAVELHGSRDEVLPRLIRPQPAAPAMQKTAS